MSGAPSPSIQRDCGGRDLCRLLIALAFLLTGCFYDDGKGAEQRLREAATQTDRYYALADSAKERLDAGDIGSARAYAEELLDLSTRLRHDWNYGNAVHDGHVVLGRIALREGRIDDARRHLALAGETPGSPQLDSFGPNMTLARDMITAGEKKAVREYFESCRKFWEMDNGRLDAWAEDVERGREPDFGANLAY